MATLPKAIMGLLLLIVCLTCLAVQSAADEIERQIQVIAKSGPNGAGASQARQAAQILAAQNTTVLPQLLKAMDTENVVAANWYRSVYEQISRQELLQKNPKFPLMELHDFVRDGTHDGRPRRLVLSLLDRLEPDFRNSFIPTQINDKEFRNDAVAELLEKADTAQQSGEMQIAVDFYRRAFRAARESGQIQTAASKLKAAGHEVSIVKQMGFVIDWYLIGPFDAPDKSGFAASFPPEQGIDLKAKYAGQGGTEIIWKRHRTDDPLGLVNFVTALGPTKEAVGYAYAEVNSPREQSAQLRCGADDNLTVWLNQEKVFAREQWLNGTRLDRFTAPIHLRSGKNSILVKVCQGPQHKNPAVGNNWSLQLRVCDENGGSVDVSPSLPLSINDSAP